MPVIPTTGSGPFDSVNDVLTAAAVRLHDHIPSLYPTGGSLLGEGQIFTQAATNNGWRKLQNFLANLGFVSLTNEVILYGVPATQQLNDSGSQVSLTWTGFYDGLAYSPTPALPSDLLFPLILWERWSSQPQGYFVQMTDWVEGLPTISKQLQQVVWEWRNQAIYMPGSLVQEDIRIRYAKLIPDFLDNPAGPTRWYQQKVPIVDCRDALAYYICSEIVTTQEDLDFDATVFNKAAEDAARLIMNRDVRKDQRVNIRRRPRSGRNRGGSYFW
jgi:hypothetical protein